MRRGILGGTFDPPHIAHLLVGETAYRHAALDVVTYVPAGAPWQKHDRDITDGEHRLAMTQRAIDGVDYFTIDDRELRRDGWTYTIDTVESLLGDDELVLIVGADAAAGIRTWHRHEDLAERVELAVVPRPDTDLGAVESALVGVRYQWIDMPLMEVSSTDLRHRIAVGRSIRFLVPEAVRQYITDHGLYAASA